MKLITYKSYLKGVNTIFKWDSVFLYKISVHENNYGSVTDDVECLVVVGWCAGCHV